jgi:hypothetical protein
MKFYRRTFTFKFFYYTWTLDLIILLCFNFMTPSFLTLIILPGMLPDQDSNNGEPGSESGSGLDTSGLQSQAMDTVTGLDLGNIYKQCSLSRSAATTIALTEIKDGNCVTSSQNNTAIGSLDWEGDDSVLRTFHGGRISKHGRTVNKCISSSFDPRNMMCLGCSKTHHILNPVKPSLIIFADQNFTPFLSGGENNCVAVCRLENATLNELVDLAMEVIDRMVLPPGTTLLFGSGSHLFRVGTSQYASDWIMLVNRCPQ